MRSCPQCRQILPDSAAHCPEDGKLLTPPDPHIGELLSGQYEVLEKIGEGGSGMVYRGWQRGVERPVAIKILSASAASSSEFVARFVREAQAAARLRHSHIITVYHIGHTVSRLPFIAMEWVPGGPLGRGAEHSLRGRYEDILVAAKQVASALAEAHGAGIVHRDLKPDNLLCSIRRGRPHVTVLDFGIAKILDDAFIKPGETHLTKLGTVYGTPQYLSPEQASGKCVDARSDLYSFGVVLYQLVSGRLPFKNKGVALLVDHLNVAPPKLQKLAPQAPPALSSLIMRLLEKDPADRPQSAAELCELLDALGQEPRSAERITEEVEPASYRPEALVDLEPRRHPRASRRARVSLAAAVLSLTLLALGSGELSMLASGAAPMATPAAPAVAHAQGAAQRGPQRALMVSADGYALRVLMPAELRAQSDAPMAIEVWDRAGRSLALPSLVVLFADESGQAQGVTVPAGHTRGRYDLARNFESAGAYSMQVLTEDAEVALRVHFEVLDAASPPNS